MGEQHSNNDDMVLRILEGGMVDNEVVDFLVRQVNNTKELWLLAKMSKDAR